mmetsp:Transcript_137986/g.440151  ORF Transcript_137986/g.440151 Transcript_137986/m.440151 type:complete len:124 (+) Transcript_137986:1031-1402(+)
MGATWYGGKSQSGGDHWCDGRGLTLLGTGAGARELMSSKSAAAVPSRGLGELHCATATRTDGQLETEANVAEVESADVSGQALPSVGDLEQELVTLISASRQQVWTSGCPDELSHTRSILRDG